LTGRRLDEITNKADLFQAVRNGGDWDEGKGAPSGDEKQRRGRPRTIVQRKY